MAEHDHRHPVEDWEKELLHERLALDFVNTVSERRSGEPIERIGTAAELVRWAQLVGLVSPAQVEATVARAERTRGLLGEARELRDALFRIGSAIAAEETPTAGDLQVLNGQLAQAAAHRLLVPERGGLRWSWDAEPTEPRRLFWEVAWDAGALFSGSDAQRVRSCPECLWLFFDSSKNHSRRWCDMAACGNRAKARRFQDRHHSDG